jgi:RNA polymerase sigma factor (sigma-70 family)
MDISQELIRNCKKQEQAAMAELFNMLAPVLKGICYRYCGNLHDAEDLLQESFIIIFTKIGSYKGEGSFEGWAKRITVNTNLNWIKKNKNQLIGLPVNPTAEPQEENDENEELAGIHTKELMRCIAQLPDGYRTIFNMYAIDELSHKEIGEKLGISESTSRSQYTRAKKNLQQLLLKENKNEKI